MRNHGEPTTMHYSGQCTDRAAEPDVVEVVLPTGTRILTGGWLVAQLVRLTVLIGLALLLLAGADVRATDDGHPVRRRRIILNDDGEVGVGPRTLPSAYIKYVATADEVPNVRFRSAVGTQVDSYFINVGATDRAAVSDGKPITNIQSSMAQFHYWGEKGQIHPDTDQATRCLIADAHEAGMEIFASIRMNDTHDSGGNVNYPLKLQRPDLLLGAEHIGTRYSHLFDGERPRGASGFPSASIMAWYWCGLDYGHAEVRQHFLDFILAYCPRYDFDGLELDYFRFARYFKLGADADHLDTMTDFVRQVRDGLNEIGRARGRSYLLAVRMPDTPSMARRIGLDIESWLAAGLVDLLNVGGGYMPWGARLKEFVDLAHRHDIPCYLCMNRVGKPVQGRSLASNFWALGSDGIYVFNFAGLAQGSEEQACLRQMGAPNTLVGLDKQYSAEDGDGNPDKGWRGMVSRPRRFPLRLIDAEPIELIVGDDVQHASRQDLIHSIVMHVGVGRVDEAEQITIEVNGKPLPDAAIKRIADNRFDAAISAPLLRRGINRVVVLPGRGSVGRTRSTVTSLTLSVRYRNASTAGR